MVAWETQQYAMGCSNQQCTQQPQHPQQHSLLTSNNSRCWYQAVPSIPPCTMGHGVLIGVLVGDPLAWFGECQCTQLPVLQVCQFQPSTKVTKEPPLVAVAVPATAGKGTPAALAVQQPVHHPALLTRVVVPHLQLQQLLGQVPTCRPWCRPCAGLCCLLRRCIHMCHHLVAESPRVHSYQQQEQQVRCFLIQACSLGCILEWSRQPCGPCVRMGLTWACLVWASLVRLLWAPLVCLV